MKSYSELMKIEGYLDRYNYLRLNGSIGEETFGHSRYLNQVLYKSSEWKKFKRDMIVRDGGCDMAHDEYPILGDRIVLHHINPVTKKDILDRNPAIFDPENVVCVSHRTHEAIHYSNESLMPHEYVARSPNDTCPWRKQG